MPVRSACNNLLTTLLPQHYHNIANSFTLVCFNANFVDWASKPSSVLWNLDNKTYNDGRSDFKKR